MARIEKTVFISYRRTDVYTALAVYENLKNQGYDVFFDYRSISSGDFEQIITANIKARAHFLIILTPTALDRCNEPGDWLDREIEFAIDEKRNIIPLFFKGFRFGVPSVSEKLTGKLKNLSRYNGLNVHEDYFEEAMQRLRTQFLSKPLDTVLHPVSTEVQKVVKEEQVAADKALKQSEEVKELVKQAKEKPAQEREFPKSSASQPVKNEGINRVPGKAIPYRLIAGIAGGVALMVLCIWGGINLWNNLSSATPEPTHLLQPATTKTSAPPTPVLGIGSTMIGKDGMILFYVPAGEFTMGSDADDVLAECQKYRSNCNRDWFIDEEPPHVVDLDAFWIDQTEITNAMYAMCVTAGVCNEPSEKSSSNRNNYYGKSEFDNYPVIYISWNDASTYCSWVGRRLPTEAEWEKAARGTNRNMYPWGNIFDGSLLNFCDVNCLESERKNVSFNDGFTDTSPVGSYPKGASPFGALDIAGNVYEWVDGWYETYPGNTMGNSDYVTKYRVMRGGSWNSSDAYSHSAKRMENPPDTGSNIGFRCVMDETP